MPRPIGDPGSPYSRKVRSSGFGGTWSPAFGLTDHACGNPKLWPISYEGQSDTACFDNALEFLFQGGYSLAHAAMMLIPEAWAGNPLMDGKRRAFDVLFNGLSIDVSPADRAKIARLPGVKAMYPVEVIQAPRPIKPEGDIQPQLDTALAMTGANVLHGMGIKGEGIKVGIIDTGIDIDHPALGGNGTPGSTPFPTARVAYGYDFVGDAYNADPTSPAYNPVPVPDANPDDCGGHGTHVAGIVGADGARLR